MDERLSIVIASPFEADLVRRIAEAEPARVRVVYEPDLLPIPRFAGDHGGIARELSDAEAARWRAALRSADILLDFDWLDPISLPVSAPRVRWVQATMSGVGDFLARTGLDGWP